MCGRHDAAKSGLMVNVARVFRVYDPKGGAAQSVCILYIPEGPAWCKSNPKAFNHLRRGSATDADPLNVRTKPFEGFAKAWMLLKGHFHQSIKALET
ncbi:hypothetical protein ROBYS_03920 [Roseobacter sp. OBYS 0001]|nr:hypothetical protein ROBYS_03920 [Roseobacter sp. OBYS 0001]